MHSFNPTSHKAWRRYLVQSLHNTQLNDAPLQSTTLNIASFHSHFVVHYMCNREQVGIQPEHIVCKSKTRHLHLEMLFIQRKEWQCLFPPLYNRSIHMYITDSTDKEKESLRTKSGRKPRLLSSRLNYKPKNTRESNTVTTISCLLLGWLK